MHSLGRSSTQAVLVLGALCGLHFLHVALLLSVRAILCRNIMLFPVVSSLKQVIKDVYFYHKFEHFLLSDSLIDMSPINSRQLNH